MGELRLVRKSLSTTRDSGTQRLSRLIPLLSQDTDLAEVLLACTEGRLNLVKIGVTPGFACNVVIAAEGYLESYRQGDLIEFKDTSAGKRTISINFKNETNSLLI